MVKITKKADYGLTFLVALTHNPSEYKSLNSIAHQFDLPYKFIGQVAAELLQAGLVVSKEGATGGYKLAKNPQDISLKLILEILDGPVVKIDCLNGKPCLRSATCNHHHIVDQLAQIIDDSLAGISLRDVAVNK